MSKVRLFLFLFVILLLLETTGVTGKQQGAAAVNYVEGELLVKFKAGSPAQSALLAHNSIGASPVQTFPTIGWQHVRLPRGLKVTEAIRRYRELPNVIDVAPNYIYKVDATANDPSAGLLYGLSKIKAPAAWDTTTGSSGVVVAVIDTGIDYDHEDLNANMWRNPGEVAGNGLDDDANGFVDDLYGYDFANDDPDPQDDYDHGTHVAGTIGAVGNNGKGVVGVNWAVSIMALKLHDVTGNGTTAAAINCFEYVTLMKKRGVNIRVTNNSWGGPPEAPSEDLALKAAIDAAGDAGILNVFAAGNGFADIDKTPFYPASFDSPSIISVASSNVDDNRSGSSNYGLSSVDIAAPGAAIYSTVIGGSGYDYSSGTSMAAPHVAGAAALLAAHNGSLSAESLKATLINSVDVLPQWRTLVKSGGRLNLSQALTTPTVCDFSLGSNEESFQPAGGDGMVSLIAPTNCDWTAESEASWITITSNTNGSGSTALLYSVAANQTPFTRTGRLTVAGKSFTVIQSADTDLDSLPDVVEAAEGTNPGVKDNDVFGSARLFVMQQYRDFLSREADAGGISYWTGVMGQGVGRAQVIDNFFNSSEFQGSIAPIARLYFSYFLRIPDYGGILYWSNAFRSGQPLDLISENFAQSAEFQKRYGSLSDTQFVTLVYQNVLGRTPSQQEIDFWVGNLNAGTTTRGLVMLGFSESDEYKARIYNEVYVTMIYAGMLRRGPDAGGFDFWVSAMDQGASGLQLIEGFLGAAEYHNRFLPPIQ